MRLLTSFTAFALVGLLVAAPTSNEDGDDKILITKSAYADKFIKYKGKYDIVKLLVPRNALNFDENESSSSSSSSSSSESNEINTNIIIFFVEAEVQPDGTHIDQGLYVLKDGNAKKILENGRDAAASGDDSKLVFFGAKDGLYVYNQNTNSADKYGPITDSIIGIAKEKEGDVIYILTEAFEVFKVWNKGESKEKIEQVVDAKQFVLDNSNNLYFYSDDKVPYVYTTDGVKKIEGLPEDYSSVNLLKPPFILDNSVPFVIDNKVYLLYANGTSEFSDFEFTPEAKPTAYAPEASLIQYYAYEKTIYEFNLLKLALQPVVEDIAKYMSDKSTQIKVLASKLKSSSKS